MRNLWIVIVLSIAAVAVAGVVARPHVVASGPVESQRAEQPAEKDSGPSKEEIAADIAKAERKLQLAQLQLEQAQLEMQTTEISAEVAVRQAEEELAIARAKLAQYRDRDAPRRIGESELALRSTRDRAAEAAEELAQIEIMYKDQDLDDRTAEFVIQRGRRNAERAQARIQLEEMALVTLREHEVPNEIRQREFAVMQKQAAVESARRSLQSQMLEGRISLVGAQSEIEELTQELERLRKKR